VPFMFSPCQPCCKPSNCGQVCVTTTLCGAMISPVPITLTRTEVDSVTLVSGGHGLNNGTFTGTFTGGGGSGGSFKYTVVGGTVVSVLLVDGGSGWASPPTLNFNLGFGNFGTVSGTTTTATTAIGTCNTDGKVVFIAVDPNVADGPIGSGYPGTWLTLPTISITGGGGSGTTARLNMAGFPSYNPHVTNGSGYKAGDLLTVVGGTFTQSIIYRVVSDQVSGSPPVIQAVQNGIYQALPANPVSFTGGHGTGFSTDFMWSILSATVLNGGNSFTSIPEAHIVETPDYSTGNAFVGYKPKLTASATASCCIPVAKTGNYKATGVFPDRDAPNLVTTTGVTPVIGTVGGALLPNGSLSGTTFLSFCGGNPVNSTATLTLNATYALISISCNHWIAPSLALPGNALPPVAGAQVVASAPGLPSITGTTNINGTVVFAVKSFGTYTFTASWGGLSQDKTGIVQGSCGASQGSLPFYSIQSVDFHADIVRNSPDRPDCPTYHIGAPNPFPGLTVTYHTCDGATDINDCTTGPAISTEITNANGDCTFVFNPEIKVAGSKIVWTYGGKSGKEADFSTGGFVMKALKPQDFTGTQITNPNYGYAICP
jgi:hypothetical protein